MKEIDGIIVASNEEIIEMMLTSPGIFDNPDWKGSKYECCLLLGIQGKYKNKLVVREEYLGNISEIKEHQKDLSH